MRCKLVEGTKENLKATVESLGVRGKMDLKPVGKTATLRFLSTQRSLTALSSLQTSSEYPSRRSKMPSSQSIPSF